MNELLANNTVGVGSNTWSNLNLFVKNCATVNKEYANFFCVEYIYQMPLKFKTYQRFVASFFQSRLTTYKRLMFYILLHFYLKSDKIK